MAPPVCPCCGCRLAAGARVCPDCGADEETGWSQGWSGEAPVEEPFDYEDFVRREFGGEKSPHRQWRPAGVSWFWWFVAVGCLGLFAAGWLFYLVGAVR